MQVKCKRRDMNKRKVELNSQGSCGFCVKMKDSITQGRKGFSCIAEHCKRNPIRYNRMLCVAEMCTAHKIMRHIHSGTYHFELHKRLNS
jgi:hypothetical protein